ncbi:MAG: asparagine--tRNA ligase [Flavobacteriaceae bacterium]|nr:asparagine--tRNA ligase [Flavobacteriaceae bacterium]MBL6684983.1 asparagine--tRNA ligase [Flavobacteriaceae bacterium]
MSKRLQIKSILNDNYVGKNIIVYGWVKTFRSNRFINLNDGSCLNDLQCVVDYEKLEESKLSKINNGACIKVKGEIVKSQGRGQNIELIANSIDILGESDPEKFPIQPKKHSFEFLRENAHLRVRTKTLSSVFRIRSEVSYAIHNFFNKNNFYYIHTPIITGSDAEGAGEMFRVTTLDSNKKNLDFSEDFFGKETNLTVSGQLEAESLALGLGNVYTFGPTFRAENSNTSRHLAEFWMIEPEMAFYDLNDNMDLAEEFIQNVIKHTYEKCKDDIVFLSDRLEKEEISKPKDQRSELSLIERIEFVINNNFKRVTYSEAFEILRNSKPNKKGKFKYTVKDWGIDFQSEHERFLVEKYFKCPVIVYDYPAKIKAFYMRLNDDKKTVRAMDILFPGIGEIVGGSQREERLDILNERVEALGIEKKELWWYLDLRKYGSVKHSGFGLGLERLILFITGMNNIRDVIPFPRTPKSAEF